MDMVAVVVIQNEQVVVATAGGNNELASLVTVSFAAGDGDDGGEACMRAVASVIVWKVVLKRSVFW